jgi:hypothetical protein
MVRYSEDDIYVFAGFSEEKTGKSEKFSTQTLVWEYVTDLPQPLQYCVATVRAGNPESVIWITSYESDSIYVYHPQAQRYSTLLTGRLQGLSHKVLFSHTNENEVIILQG